MKTNSTIFRHHEKPLSRQAPREIKCMNRGDPYHEFAAKWSK